MADEGIDRGVVAAVAASAGGLALVVYAVGLDALGFPEAFLGGVILAWAAWLLHVDRRRREGVEGGGFLRRARSERTVLASMLALALVGGVSWIHGGRFHGGGRVLHDHELVHYGLGARWFEPLGHDGLYAALTLALVEDAPERAETLSLVKNLRTYDLEGLDAAVERGRGVRARFDDEGWEAFKADVRVLDARMQDRDWSTLLVDHGFNATPFWRMLAAPWTAAPLSGGALLAMALVDPVLLLLALLAVRRSFGRLEALLVAVVFFVNPFASFGFTGGAFLRLLWWSALLGAAAAWRSGRPVLAGSALAVATLDRVFPGLFVVPWVVAALRGRATPAGRDALRAVVAFGAAGLGLFGLTLATSGGLGAWEAFLANIQAHERFVYLNQIALRNLFLSDPISALASLVAFDEAAWTASRQAASEGTAGALTGLRLVLGAGLLAAMARAPGRTTGLALAAFLPFVLLYPANYYYLFLLVPLLALAEAPSLAIGLVALLALARFLAVPLGSPLAAESLHGLISWGLLGLTVGAIVRGAGLRWPGALGLAGAAVGAVVVGRVVAPAPSPGFTDHDLLPADVAPAPGLVAVSEPMRAFGQGWRGGHQLRLDPGASGGEATLRFDVGRGGPHRLKLVATRTPVFGDVSVALDGAPVALGLSLYDEGVALAQTATAVELEAGEHALTVAVRGADPRARGRLVGLDRIVAVPAWDKTPRAALDAVLGWIVAHPADGFDGGARGVADEVDLLVELALRDAAWRPRLAERLAALGPLVAALPTYERPPFQALAARAQAVVDGEDVPERPAGDPGRALSEALADGQRHGDVLAVAQVVHQAAASGDRTVAEAGVAWLVALQEPAGHLGPVAVRRTDPTRAGALAFARALVAAGVETGRG